MIFLSVGAIGDTNVMDLPVANSQAAAKYYRERLGFSISASEPHAATVSRDNVVLRLAENGGDPEQASGYISVSDIDEAMAEFHASGFTGDIQEIVHENIPLRIFWLRDEDGICWCIGQRVE